MPTDGYILAIPLTELHGAAVEATPACRCQRHADRQQCAAALVRARLCPCLLDAPRVVDAIASDFCAWMDTQGRTAPSRGRALTDPQEVA